MRCFRWVLILFLLASMVGCAETLDGIDPPADDEVGPNPFLEPVSDGKEDSGYLNLRGREVHVTLEADIRASSWRIFDAPPELAQFAVTYLRKRDSFYLEILAEDATAPDRVEWRVDGQWLSRSEAAEVPREQLTHFRMNEVSAVVTNTAATNVRAGQVFEAEVPYDPYTIMTDAGENCADPDSHLGLSQSIYWYLWNPDRSGCELETQTMTLTVTELMPDNPESYPEYDQLWADGRLDVVVLFGKLDDGDVADDYNWANVDRFATWLTEANFVEVEDAPLGRRFSRQVGELTEVIDVYGPDLFYSVADYARFDNWQKAVSEHEVVLYNGHSVLGTGMAFERVEYPERYQIFQIASCLSYEYYVWPVLAGKGDWESVDIVSNVEPTYYSENLPLTSTLLAKLMAGFENGGQVSWQDIMEAISRRLYHNRFGVSGARGNCFSPEGDRCGEDPGPDPDTVLFEDSTPVAIPDNDPAGASATITVDVDEPLIIGSLAVEIDLTHTWVGDLELVLSHGDIQHTLWNRTGGSDDNIRASFRVDAFNGTDAAGTWTLHVVDHAAIDVGTLNSWRMTIGE